MWTSTDIELGNLPDDGDVKVFDLATKIPHTATEILVYAWVETGQAYPTDHRWHFKIFVDIDNHGKEAAFYLLAHTYPNQELAWSYNSDNVWLPMPHDKKLKISLDYTGAGKAIEGYWNSGVKIIAYR